jgi:NADH-quinone oxidoreductase subunit L
MSGLWLWLLIGVPGAAGMLLGVFGRGVDRVAPAIGIVVGVGVVIDAFALAAGGPTVSAPFVADARFALAVTGLSAVIVPSVAVVALLVLVFAAANPEGGIAAAPARFFGFMLLFLAAVLVTAAAATLPALLFSWEIMGATSYALIGFRWQQADRVAGGMVAFLTTRTADLGLYVAAGAALAGGSMDLDRLPELTGPWRDVAAAGVLLAGLGKAAQLPFSFWLSRAMSGPSPVSALLHSAAMVAMGGYLLLRTSPLLAAVGWAGTAAAWVGALTALVLGAVAVAQRDLKQLLAASTAAQLGFVVLAAGVSATAAGSAQLVAHAATKALLFLVAGAWLGALGTKALPALTGVARRWPVVGVTATVGLLALAGAPPLSLWATKDGILAAVQDRSTVLAVITLAAAAMSAAYAAVVLRIIWARPTPDAQATIEAHFDEEEAGTRRVPAAAQTVLVPLAVAAATLGVLMFPPLAGRWAATVGDPGRPQPGAVELIGSAVLVLVVIAVVVWRPPLKPAWATGWLGLEGAAHAVVVRPTLAVAASLARFDDAVIDRPVAATGRAVLALARLADRVDRSGIDGAVTGVARGAARLGRLARRPETGQIYQYYLQAVLVLLATAVFLVWVA